MKPTQAQEEHARRTQKRLSLPTAPPVSYKDVSFIIIIIIDS